jgi:pyruvate dehydrogenase E1 component
LTATGGAYTRETFFGTDPELKAMVANMSDEEIWRLNRGGHDPRKVFAAYAAAMQHKGQPTVILAKTVKGFGMGKAGEGQMVTHQQKKLSDDDLREFRDRFNIPVSDDELARLPFCKPEEESEEMRYMRTRRVSLGGYLPARRRAAAPLEIPPLETFKPLLESSEGREISTTMAFVRLLTTLLKDKQIGKQIVPIVPDEARTFGMEGLFRQVGIYSSVGQLYTPQDADQLMSYREDKKGQILEEGINEAGAMCSWMAAGTAYTNHGINMVPFYIFYSMFGFQRVGDFIWAAGDMQTRGFLLGATAGRTTLAGEGLQHQDGHSQLLATTVPNCRSYDPTFAYELAVIIHDGLRRMYVEGEPIFYYVTVMNENYAMPAMPQGAEQGILQGLYPFSTVKPTGKPKAKATLLGSGTILREVIKAAEHLAADYGIEADILSAPSWNELRREALECERWNLLHPGEPPRKPYVASTLAAHEGPFIAASDYVRNVPDQIRQWVPGRYVVLGTDGYGRSDAREALRHHFEVDHRFIVLAALRALADEGQISIGVVEQAIQSLGIDPAKSDPLVS